jgi:predicted N-acetyltransferase YhbS
MEVRPLRRDEREALLALLDGWELPDGWRGRDFFRRYVEQDPTFADANVWVAEEGGALVSCVQIFPRTLRVAGANVATGGIGSVFTAPSARRRGIAEAVFVRTMEAMRERGLALGLLFGGEPLYARQGWRNWGVPAGVLQRSGASPAAAPPPAPGIAIEAFARARDLADVRALHAEYSDALSGTIVRDAALWEASLAVAGNPDEEFLVARAHGELAAYARATLLYGFVNVMELGCRPGFEGALAALVARILAPRDADPWEPRAGRPSASLRTMAITVPLHFAPDLAAALAAAGVSWRAAGDTKTMLACLDPAALAAATGERGKPGEAPLDALARILPASDFTFWPADRF